LNRDREDRTRHDRAQSAGNERLQRTAQRIAGKTLETFGEVVDPEQEQAQSTHERHGGEGVHRLFLLRRVIEHNVRPAVPVHLSRS
jgi:hypothetical protein